MLFFDKEYSLSIYSGKRCWWSIKYIKWVTLNYLKKDSLSSYKMFKNKKEAFIEFDKLTKKGIDCSFLIKRRFLKDICYNSTDQDYFKRVKK